MNEILAFFLLWIMELKKKILSRLNMKSTEDLFNVSLLSYHHLVTTSLTVCPQFIPSVNM